MDWQPIDENTPFYKAVLTLHKEDLYPVPAYKLPASATEPEVWLRETEGPEDGFYGGGRHQPLYRAPTWWLDLDALPPPPEAP